MQLSFDETQPIYEQIIHYLKKQIARRELGPGDRLPSQRRMARRVGVNPNTIQRAYRELEITELVETRRGKGTFISQDEQIIRGVRRDMAREAIQGFISEMQSIGFSGEEMLDKLKNELKVREGNER